MLAELKKSVNGVISDGRKKRSFAEVQCVCMHARACVCVRARVCGTCTRVCMCVCVSKGRIR